MNQVRIDQHLTARQLDERTETRIALRFLRDSLAWEHRLATLRGTRLGDTQPPSRVWIPGTPPGAGDRDTHEVGAGSDRAAW